MSLGRSHLWDRSGQQFVTGTDSSMGPLNAALRGQCQAAHRLRPRWFCRNKDGRLRLGGSSQGYSAARL
jgi:hypothetical protein